MHPSASPRRSSAAGSPVRVRSTSRPTHDPDLSFSSRLVQELLSSSPPPSPTTTSPRLRTRSAIRPGDRSIASRNSSHATPTKQREALEQTRKFYGVRRTSSNGDTGRARYSWSAGAGLSGGSELAAGPRVHGGESTVVAVGKTLPAIASVETLTAPPPPAPLPQLPLPPSLQPTATPSLTENGGAGTQEELLADAASRAVAAAQRFAFPDSPSTGDEERVMPPTSQAGSMSRPTTPGSMAEGAVLSGVGHSSSMGHSSITPLVRQKSSEHAPLDSSGDSDRRERERPRAGASDASHNPALAAPLANRPAAGIAEGLTLASVPHRTTSGVLDIRMPGNSEVADKDAGVLPRGRRRASSARLSRGMGSTKSRPLLDSALARQGSAYSASDNPAPGQRKRYYQVYPGNLWFPFGGRLVTSRPAAALRLSSIGRYLRRPSRPLFPMSRGDSRSKGSSITLTNSRISDTELVVPIPWTTLISFVLIMFLGLLFLGSQASYLSTHSSAAVPVIFAYVWLGAVASMWKAGASDPGVLPRDLDPNPEVKWKSTAENGVEGRGDMEVGEWEVVKRWARVQKPGGGLEWCQRKWCAACKTYRPPRSSHCRRCDSCIMGIDHHCVYINNCIGARNYGPFVHFLLACVLGSLMVVGFSAWRITNEASAAEGGFRQICGESGIVAALVLVIVGGIVTVPVASLLGYHLYLILRGLTTIEYLRLQTQKKAFHELVSTEPKDTEKQPPADAILGNPDASAKDHVTGEVKRRLRGLVWRLCRPDTETWIDWRQWVSDEAVEVRDKGAGITMV